MARRPLLQLGLVLLLAAAVVAGAVAVSSGGGEAPAPAPGGPAAEAAATAAEQVAALYAGIPQDGVRLGRPNAPATLIEFADLQCPFCAQYSVQAMPEIIRDYVRTGRIAYELRIRAFLGRDSVRAAGAAAYAASRDRLYQFADLFYRNQGLENSGYVDSAFIRSLARRVDGLDPAEAGAAADRPLAFALVHRGERLARRRGSTGTPDFYVRRDGDVVPLGPQGTAPGDYAAALDRVLAGS